MSKVVWKDIEGYEGFYQVSNKGRIKSFARETLNKRGILMRFKGKILSNKSFDKNGYVLQGLTINKKTKTFKAHRLVALEFIPNPDILPEVNHINGIKNDNRVENLEWSTTSYNQLHSVHVLKNKVLKGEEIGNSRLTEELVRELRDVKKYMDISYTQLQEIYGIKRATIHLAVTRKTWRHVK